MPNIRVRTREARATMTVECAGPTAAPHKVVIGLDGTVEFSAAHNAEHDAVMRALGAEPHPCQVAVQAHRAATIVYRALIGEADAPDLYANQNKQIRSRKACPSCPTYGPGSLMHIHSTDHQAKAHETEPQTVKTLLRWMVRNSPHRDYIGRDLLPALPGGMALEYGCSHYGFAPNLVITQPFLAAATTFIPEGTSPHDAAALVRTMRQQGITVQWARKLVSLLTPAARGRMRREAISIPALIGARNIAPEKVALYINAGINANYYTYAKVNANPQDVLRVFQQTNRQQTLAQALREGVTIPDALERIG